MLTQKQSEQYRKILNQQLTLLQDEVSKADAAKQRADEEAYADWTDMASVETNKDILLKIRDRDKKMVGEVYAALQRIEAKTFGECLNCGDDISISRLKARPTTTLCIDCMSATEVVSARYR
jgi:DnaK suppressor protein